MASAVQRKLTAILMADVQGYSRLMGADEEETLRRLREYQEVIGRRIEEYRGRLVDAPGDALLADFASVVDAVRCAVEVQNELGRRNAELPADRRMDLRMGLNLGDVIVDGDSLYGDGVNIAARLEPLAEGGGICISGTVYDSIHNKMDLNWEYLGEQTLKNIAQPIRAFRMSLKEGSETPEITPGQPVSSLVPAYTEAAATGSYPLVGRQEELSFLQGRVDAISEGKGSVVFITGEAGIGKTRLAREARNYAQSRGCQWLEGKYEKIVSQPYKAWSDVVRSYLRQSGSTPPDILASPYAVYLQKIVPEVETQLKDAPKTAAQVDPEGERSQLFEGVTQFLIHVSREAPLVLFIDDLQWASSIEILQYLARNIGNHKILLLATYREEEVKENTGVWNTVLAMNRERLSHSLTLKVLGEGDVSQLMSHTVEKSMAPKLVDIIFERTQGNPFFVEEMMRFLWDRGSIVATEAGWNVIEPMSLKTPDSVKAVINERLVRFGKEAEELLRVASVIGREFPLRVLREMVDLGDEEMIEVIDRCEESGLIVARQSPGEEVYGFTHDLVQEALYESIGTGRKRRNHLRIAQAIEEIYETRLDDWCDSLAHHFMEGNDLQKTVEYGERATQRAIDTYSYNSAVRLLEHVIKAQAALNPNDQAKRCDLLLKLGSTLGPSGDPQRVAEVLAPEALDLAEKVGDGERASQCCQMALEGMWRYGGASVTRSAAWRQWAERASDYAAPGTKHQVLADIALSQVYLEQLQWREYRKLTVRAAQAAREVNEPELLFKSISELIKPTHGIQHYPEGLLLVEEFMAAPKDGLSTGTLMFFLHRAQAIFLAAGSLNRAQEAWRELDELASRTRDSRTLLWRLLLEGLQANLDGDLENAAAAKTGIVTLSNELGILAYGRLKGFLISFRPLLYLGRVEEALADLEAQRRPVASRNLWAIAPFAWDIICLAQMGRMAEAQKQLNESLKQFNISEEENEAPAPILVNLLEAAVLVQDQETASLLAKRLRGNVALATTELFVSDVGRHLAGAAALLGDWQEARANCQHALDWATKIHYRPEIALTRFEFAQLLSAEADDVRDPKSAAALRSEAQMHLDYAIDEFRAMKMQPVLERALSLKNS